MPGVRIYYSPDAVRDNGPTKDTLIDYPDTYRVFWHLPKRLRNDSMVSTQSPHLIVKMPRSASIRLRYVYDATPDTPTAGTQRSKRGVYKVKHTNLFKRAS